ncbi:MAG: succinylglutamate desuccinylase/aspartoacylase family protein [bacterium]
MKIKYSFLKILTGSDLSRRRLPIMQIESGRRGPVLWITACGHGDEVGGMVIIQEIFKKIRKTGLLRGKLFAFPLMNPIGFEMGSRQVSFSMEDLNRSFPGNSSGSLAERIAEKIFTSITATNPTLVIDLHNDWMKSIPYALLDIKPPDHLIPICQKTADYGQSTGFLVVQDTDDLHHTLSRSLIHEGIPALTLEVGESFVVNEKNVDYGVKAILNVLSTLRMIEPVDEMFCHTVTAKYDGQILKFSSAPVSSSSGIIRFLVKPGDILKKDQPVARIYNAFGKLQETLLTQQKGIVLGHADSSVAYPGASIMAFGIL